MHGEFGNVSSQDFIVAFLFFVGWRGEDILDIIRVPLSTCDLSIADMQLYELEILCNDKLNF